MGDINQQSNNNFDYFKNRKKIKTKLKEIKKEFPIMQKVRLFKKIKKQNKRSHRSTWSNAIYVVKGYKIPLLSDSDVGIYLTDMNGKQIKGITYRENLKKVKKSDYIQIKKIIAYMKRKKSVRCSFDNYPNSYYKDILLSDLNKYSIPKRIRQEINNWRKKMTFRIKSKYLFKANILENGNWSNQIPELNFSNCDDAFLTNRMNNINEKIFIQPDRIKFCNIFNISEQNIVYSWFVGDEINKKTFTIQKGCYTTESLEEILNNFDKRIKFNFVVKGKNVTEGNLEVENVSETDIIMSMNRNMILNTGLIDIYN